MNSVSMNVYNSYFIDLNIYQAGREQCLPGYSFGPARREHYLFHYIVGGTGILYADDETGITRTYGLKSGEGFFMYPNQINMYIADMNDPWEYIWIEFDGVHVRENLSGVGYTENNPVYRSDSDEVRNGIKSELSFIIENPKASLFRVIGHLYIFFDYIMRSQSNLPLFKGRTIKDYYIRAALEYINEFYNRQITVEDIAAHCGIDRSYFGKLFRNYVGKSPHAFLMQYRMNIAMDLLQNTDKSITQIAHETGYENPLHFSRAFKNIFGESPKKWRAGNKRLQLND